jgi:uncharacterized membrane protein SpoIIM required for sporulation
MKEAIFWNRRAAKWLRLQELCRLCESGIGRLRPTELAEFIALYRLASADLAYVRTRASTSQSVDQLNDVVARAHAQLYTAPRRSFLDTILTSIILALQTLYRRRLAVVFAFVTLMISAIVAYVALDVAPQVRSAVVPGGFESSFDMWKKGQYPNRSTAEGTQATLFYASNNPRVAVMTAAMGAATLGIESYNLNFMNGAALGALFHEVRETGRQGFVATSIFAHGVPEIGGILCACAAGFIIGGAVLFPGRRRRGDAVKAAGIDAIVLTFFGVIGCYIAAPIEGFISFNASVPAVFKVLFGTAELAAIFFLVFRYGRTSE